MPIDFPQGQSESQGIDSLASTKFLEYAWQLSMNKCVADAIDLVIVLQAFMAIMFPSLYELIGLCTFQACMALLFQHKLA
jgi:hypothetical protein